MKRKAAFWFVMFLVSMFIGGCYSMENYRNIEALSRFLGFDGRYDFNNNLVKARDLDIFFDYKVYAKVSVTLEVLKEIKDTEPDDANKRYGTSPAIVVGKYVLMASHTNDPESFNKEITTLMTPIGYMTMQYEFKILAYSVAVIMADGLEIPLKELYRNKEKDFSLFEMPENVKVLNFPFEIGKSNELKIGHFIYLNGQPGINSAIARPGFITSLANAILGNTILEIEKNGNEFNISQSTDKGDSGSPVMAFKDGRPELVGIYLGWISKSGDNGRNTRSRALKINVAIDEIKEKLGVDLRELQHEILNK